MGLDQFNHFAWVASNLLVVYISVMLLVFVIGYSIFFDPKATTAGKYIFRFFISLCGVIGLIFIGIFIDPANGLEWFNLPKDTIIWRPIVRLIAYSYVAFTVTNLAVLLVVRKWFPNKLRTKLDRHILILRKKV